MRIRSIEFKATVRLVIPLLLACSIALFSLTPTLALAGEHNNNQPFLGTVSGIIPEDLGPPVPGTGGCVFNFFVPNSRNATVLGSFTGTVNFIRTSAMEASLAPFSELRPTVAQSPALLWGN
jgi:hypothetical protein